MTATHTFFKRPRLRDGVSVEQTDEGFAVLYRRQSTDLGVPPGAGEQVAGLLSRLQSGATADELSAAAPDLGDLDAFLDELDRLGLITEGEPRPVSGVWSGIELYRTVRAAVADLQLELGPSELYRHMMEGTVTRTMLIGYAIEYHHVVAMSPALIGPALAHPWSVPARATVERFLGEELGHDTLTKRSLASVGVSADQLERLEPLPATFAVASTLGAVAAQDPLSFAACLFLVEETQPEFNIALKDAAERLGLPADFYQPLLEHSGFNEEGGHADLSAELLETVACVGREHEQAVLKQAFALAESLHAMDRQIVSYYGTDELTLRDFRGAGRLGTR